MEACSDTTPKMICCTAVSCLDTAEPHSVKESSSEFAGGCGSEMSNNACVCVCVWRDQSLSALSGAESLPGAHT
jgi:hypothetical protein